MKTHILKDTFQLESGETLSSVQIAYHTYGRLNKEKNNVIWVCHTLTANSDVISWWKELFGQDSFLNMNDYFIICANALGSCYGTTGPTTPLVNKRPLLDYFPFVSTRDMAALYEELRKFLGIKTIKLLIGASLGGQQALEWAVERSEFIEKLVLIATNARHSAFGIAFNESQRLAIKNDPTYGNGKINGGRNGLIVARSIALLSYRTYKSYNKTQTNQGNQKLDGFLASTYQHYQGYKLANRFNAYSYVTLTKAMDAHNVGRGRESVEIALSKIKSKTLVVGISSDQLFPTEEQKFLSLYIPNSDFKEINSDFGHDGFLIEVDAILTLIKDFFDDNFQKHRLTNFKYTVKHPINYWN